MHTQIIIKDFNYFNIIDDTLLLDSDAVEFFINVNNITGWFIGDATNSYERSSLELCLDDDANVNVYISILFDSDSDKSKNIAEIIHWIDKFKNAK